VVPGAATRNGFVVGGYWRDGVVPLVVCRRHGGRSMLPVDGVFMRKRVEEQATIDGRLRTRKDGNGEIGAGKGVTVNDFV
jgi:hypothetical protein